ncbi:MAG: anti-sigma factor family protein [Myxococcota bacterium]
MNCRDLESELTPWLDGELIAEARVEFEAHLATCEPCRAHAERERHNLSLIRQAAKADAPTAPPALKAKLFESIRADADRRRGVTVRRVTALAAGVTLAIVVGHQGWRVHQRRLYEQDAALRHARQFPLEIEQSPEAIERWFGGKVDYRVSVPRFPNTRVGGARLLQVRDKPAAYIRYDAPRQMGLFVYGDDHDVDVGSEPAVGSSHGYNVVSWREGDVVYQLVTDLDEHDIRELIPSPPGESLTPRTPELDVRPAALQR